MVCIRALLSLQCIIWWQCVDSFSLHLWLIGKSEMKRMFCDLGWQVWLTIDRGAMSDDGAFSSPGKLLRVRILSSRPATSSFQRSAASAKAQTLVPIKLPGGPITQLRSLLLVQPIEAFKERLKTGTQCALQFSTEWCWGAGRRRGWWWCCWSPWHWRREPLPWTEICSLTKSASFRSPVLVRVTCAWVILIMCCNVHNVTTRWIRMVVTVK